MNEILNALKVIPSDTIVAKYMVIDGVYTAERMINEIENNTQLGQNFITDLINIGFDLVIRKAKRIISFEYEEVGLRKRLKSAIAQTRCRKIEQAQTDYYMNGIAHLYFDNHTPIQRQEFYKNISDRLINRLKNELSIPPPRTGDNNGKAISHWLDDNKESLLALLTELLAQEFKVATNKDNKKYLRDIAEITLQGIAHEIRMFALNLTALRWGAGRYPNFAEFCDAKASIYEGWWTIPVKHIKNNEWLGQVVLDAEGNIIEEYTTTRDEIREIISKYSTVGTHSVC